MDLNSEPVPGGSSYRVSERVRGRKDRRYETRSGICTGKCFGDLKIRRNFFGECKSCEENEKEDRV